MWASMVWGKGMDKGVEAGIGSDREGKRGMEGGGKGISLAMPAFNRVQYFPASTPRQLPIMFTALQESHFSGSLVAEGSEVCSV